jgi:hypothetical protein
VLVTYLVAVLMVSALGYWMTTSGRYAAASLKALLVGAVAALALYDGITLGVHEYARAHDGRVSSGVVTGKSSSIDEDGARRTSSRRRWRRGLPITAEGYRIHDWLSRLILTGSPTAWIIEYRFACERAVGCRGLDFVPETRWHQLSNGDPIDVRRGNDEYGSSRLDDNPQWGAAVVDVGIGGTLMLFAGMFSGLLSVPGRRRYLTAPAVVTAIEPLTEDGVTRWRVRFAYVDQQGTAQESVDRIATDDCKPGDECLAVFTPGRPDLAGFRPISS